jgi:hypothetical protein
VSYCRSSEDSDAYVFGSGTHLECYLTWRASDHAEIPHHFAVAYDDKGTAELAMIGWLRYVQSKGLRVPDYAFDRLFREANEIQKQRFEKGNP